MEIERVREFRTKRIFIRKNVHKYIYIYGGDRTVMVTMVDDPSLNLNESVSI